MGLHGLRQRIVDSPDSWGARRRARRWNWFLKSFPDLDQLSVIDLGGRYETWEGSAVRPKHVHVVNLEPVREDVPDWVQVSYADACALPPEIAERRYDLVFSNSVIEHVGGHERRLRFAESVHKLADRHWVQTPYRYFPVEPHWIAPFMQFLPLTMRARVCHRWPLSHTKVPDRQTALTSVMWTELIDKTQMRYYFPDSTLRGERFLGLTKSLIAVKAK